MQLNFFPSNAFEIVFMKAEGMNIQGTIDLTAAQKVTLKAQGSLA